MAGKTSNYHTNRANKYARDVVNGKIPACLYIIQACKRHLDDLEKSKKSRYPYIYDPAKGEKACNFVEKMPHIKGKWVGTTIKLEPWQSFILTCLFGWIRKKDGLRRFREMYAEVPRKNSKSTLGAGIANYMFTADGEPAAEVFSGATSLDQAMEVFRPAWKMTKKTPPYMRKFGVELGGTDKNPGPMYSMQTDSRMEPVVGKPGDGASPHCAIVDEYHEHATDHMYDCFATGMGSREQPILAAITTAGTNTAGPCYNKRLQAIKVLSGEIDNPELFIMIYTIDKEDDWTDFEVWKKANPNYGVSVFHDFLFRQYQEAIRDARKQNILKCKHLNVWNNAAEAFFNMVDYERCSDSMISLNDFYGEQLFLGLDLASKIDLVSVMLLFRKGTQYYLFSKYFLPEGRTRGEDMAHYAGWVHEGYIEVCGEERIDFDMVQEFIEECAKKFDLSGHKRGGGEICNDPWNAQQMMSNLEKKSLAITEIPQTVNMLSEPMKELEAIIKDGCLHHDGNPVTYWCFSNTMVKRDKKDNVFPFKLKDENKIDGTVATATAMCRAMVGNAKKTIVLPQSV